MSSSNGTLLLLSGGIDSSAIAAWIRPGHTLFIDYGQVPAGAEATAAREVARALDIPHSSITVNASAVGAGLLSGEVVEGAPSPEWWPFRNQLLVSIAAAWVVSNRRHFRGSGDEIEILVGSVAPDGLRHLDGAPSFYGALDSLLQTQEGGVRVSAPAIELDTPDLVRVSNVEDSVLGWTHSCHRSGVPCGACPGCYKRAAVLSSLERLQ